MKRLFLVIALALALLPSSLWAAAPTPGACTQVYGEIYSATGPTAAAKLTFTCTASVDDGSIPNTATAQATTDQIAGRYLYTITAYPTVGGTAPDAADVFILNANGEDLLGSVDGGTTANKGLNLIHATLTKTTFPYTHYLSQAYFPTVTGALTLKVLNQATVSANYTIELVFVR